MAVYIFTSITYNYLPKSSVLAKSVKSHNPEWKFVLLISEPIDFETREQILDTGYYDEVIFTEELDLRDFYGNKLAIEEKLKWIFKHNIVELCTAVKGACLSHLLKRQDSEAVIYLDPDIVVFNDLTILTNYLQTSSILLTPHQTVPEATIDSLMDNEICSLVHGVFNLGFVAVKPDKEGLAFADWWEKRLSYKCYDEKINGIFTDQRWIDLAPCFFSGIKILRDPGFNVCTWNLTHRNVTGSINSLAVNGESMYFYHFSGFDSGAQLIMLKKYGNNMPALFEIREWYLNQCESLASNFKFNLSWGYQKYQSGEIISNSERVLYRLSEDLIRRFPKPFDSGESSYQIWFKNQNKNNKGVLYNSKLAGLVKRVMTYISINLKLVLYFI